MILSQALVGSAAVILVVLAYEGAKTLVQGVRGLLANDKAAIQNEIQLLEQKATNTVVQLHQRISALEAAVTSRLGDAEQYIKDEAVEAVKSLAK